MLMRAAGLTNTHVTMLGGGTVAIHTGIKARAPGKTQGMTSAFVGTCPFDLPSRDGHVSTE